MSRNSSSTITRFAHRAGTLACGVALAALLPTITNAQIVDAVASTSTATIQSFAAAFRTALGPLNPNVAGSFGSGRREINWDGVPDNLAAPNALPANFFNVTSPRGVVLSTPGTGFAVSANANSGTAVNFGNIDPTFATRFAPFSAQRLFTPIGSNITDVSFFIPGSTNAAVSTAFGLVFSDVDLDTSTSLEFFDSFNSSMGIFHAFGIAGVDQSFSFLGVRFTGGQAFSRVRITSGTQLVARGNPDNDMVVMDDFIYAEPTLLVQQVVPEPATWALLSLGLTAVGIAARRRGR
jgi:hypothetical protein